MSPKGVYIPPLQPIILKRWLNGAQGVRSVWENRMLVLMSEPPCSTYGHAIMSCVWSKNILDNASLGLTEIRIYLTESLNSVNWATELLRSSEPLEGFVKLSCTIDMRLGLLGIINEKRAKTNCAR